VSKQFNFQLFFRKINFLWLVATVLVFVGLVKLGFWQSDRALEKEQRLSRIETLNSQTPISLQKLISIDSKENINDFPVLIDGEFNQKFVFLLDNQVNKSGLGYRVLQVVETEQFAVLVNLGWVLGSIDRQELPDVTALKGKHQFKGHVRLIESGIMLMEQNFENAQWPLRIQAIELDKFSPLINRKLLPFVIYVDKNETMGYEKNWQAIVMPPEKHRAYAFQWFSLSIAWLILMIWFAFFSNGKIDDSLHDDLRKSS